jgi:hypothetical protein
VMVAALYVRPDGPYAGRPDVELWDELRDARTYAGPHPVVAHPPCARWGRFWYRGELGADDGCFAAALDAVRKWGGVLEHPEISKAWDAFGLPKPKHGRGWERGVFDPGWSCSVDQSCYGHRAQKRTWLYYVGDLEPLPLERATKRTKCLIARRPGRRAADCRRLGIEVLDEDERELTPVPFAEALLALARHSRLQPVSPGAASSVGT